jgi:multidrug efflux pump subunit AcrA (membrane-fusion protein)
MSTDSQQFSPTPDDEYVRATKQQVRNMVAEIAQMSKSDAAPEEFYEALLSRAVSALVAVGGAVWTLNENGRLDLQYQINLQGTGLAGDEQGQQRHGRLLYKAVNEPEGLLVGPKSGSEDDEEAANPTDWLLILGPMTADREPRGLVEIFQRPGAGPVTQRGYLRFLMQLCDLAGNYLAKRELRHFEDRQNLWGQLDQFTRAVHESLDPRRTAYTVVNEGRRLIECDRVSLAVYNGRKCKIEAISNQDLIDKRSNVAALLGRLATRVVKTGDPMWYTGDTKDMPPQIEDAVHEYVDESHAKIVGVLPLMKPKTQDTAKPEDDPRDAQPDEVLGALIVEQFDAGRLQERTLQRVDVVKDHASSALGNSLEHNNLFLMPVWRAIGKTKFLVQARTLPKTIAVSAAILLFILFLCFWKVDFELNADGRLRPVIRRNVYAFEPGLVNEVLVRHKTLVKEGETLVRMTSNSLLGQIAEIQGKRDATWELVDSLRAQIQQRSLPPGDKQRIQSELKQQQKFLISYEEQLKVLRERQGLLTLTSPIKGQVSTWDVRRRLNQRTVEPGQLLMTISDPAGPWELELYVGDNRMGHIDRWRTENKETWAADKTEQRVTYVLASDPETELEGTVEEIQSNAVPRQQHGNTVLFRVKINKKDIDASELTEGTDVTAKIHCGRAAIGYVWFHDALDWVRKLLFKL